MRADIDKLVKGHEAFSTLLADFQSKYSPPIPPIASPDTTHDDSLNESSQSDSLTSTQLLVKLKNSVIREFKLDPKLEVILKSTLLDASADAMNEEWKRQFSVVNELKARGKKNFPVRIVMGKILLNICEYKKETIYTRLEEDLGKLGYSDGKDYFYKYTKLYKLYLKFPTILKTTDTWSNWLKNMTREKIQKAFQNMPADQKPFWEGSTNVSSP